MFLKEEERVKCYLFTRERIPCEVWTRVMGYYKPTSTFNKGKQSEVKERVHFDITNQDEYLDIRDGLNKITKGLSV